MATGSYTYSPEKKAGPTDDGIMNPAYPRSGKIHVNMDTQPVRKFTITDIGVGNKSAPDEHKPHYGR